MTKSKGCCPKCGAAQIDPDIVKKFLEYQVKEYFTCGTIHNLVTGEVVESMDCLRNRLKDKTIEYGQLLNIAQIASNYAERGEHADLILLNNLLIEAGIKPIS